MSYEYKVVPFKGVIKSAVYSEANANEVARQQQVVIDANAVDEWEFYRIDHVEFTAAPGCFGMLMGARAGVITLDQVTFRRERSGAA